MRYLYRQVFMPGTFARAFSASLESHWQAFTHILSFHFTHCAVLNVPIKIVSMFAEDS